MSRTICMLCAAVLLTASAKADLVVYDSAGSSTGGIDGVTSFGPLYDSFSTGSSGGTIDKLQLLLYNDNSISGSFVVGLYSDSATNPGSLIADLATVNDSTLASGFGLLDVVLTAQPELTADTRYWIGLAGNTAADWAWTLDSSGIGVNSEYFANMNGSFANNPNGGYQMDVGINPPSPAPEPATVLLSALALAALAMLARRRRHAVN